MSQHWKKYSFSVSDDETNHNYHHICITEQQKEYGLACSLITVLLFCLLCQLEQNNLHPHFTFDSTYSRAEQAHLFLKKTDLTGR